MNVDDIVKVLKNEGKVVALKTDTVYGLVCNAYDKIAVDKIYNIKNREKKKPLALFIGDIKELEKYIDYKSLNKNTISQLKKYWPGALTVLFKKKDDSFNYLLNDGDRIGIRIPNDKTLLDILERVDFPLAETSCNISGEKEYESASVIREKLGKKIDLIVDGGTIGSNIPSTIISINRDEIDIIRSGALDIDVQKF